MVKTCMENFPRECRGKCHGYGDKISDNPAGWECNCRKSGGSGRKNRESTAGGSVVSLLLVGDCSGLQDEPWRNAAELSADPVDSLLFLHSAFADNF